MTPKDYWVNQLKYLAKAMGLAARGNVNRLSWAGFVSHYKGPKLRRYQKALEKLTKLGWEAVWSRTEMFVKPDSADPEVKGSYDCRAIQGRHPCYNVLLGSYIKPFEEWFIGVTNWDELLGQGPGGLHSWTIPSGRLVAKGLSMGARGRLLHEKWVKLESPVAVGCDAHRFDMHVSKLMLMMEHLVYLWAFYHNPELAALLEEQLYNRGRTFGGLRYKVKGGRMSGDMNTGIGNTIIMLFIFIFFCSYLNSKSGNNGGFYVSDTFYQWDGKWEFLCDGDDSVFMTNQWNLAAFQSQFPSFAADLGFKMEVEEPVYRFEHVDFCQSRPIQVGSDWILVRKPRKALSGALCAKRPLRNMKEIRQHLWAVGKCELSLGAGVPIMQAFAEACIRNGSKTKAFDSVRHEMSYRYWYLDTDVQVKPISVASRVSYEAAFGIPIAIQVYLEEILSKWSVEDMETFRMEEPIDLGVGRIIMDAKAEVLSQL